MTSPEKYLQALRKFCLALPETVETDSFGHPNFRAGKKTFCAVEWVKGRPSVAFRLDPADQAAVGMLADFFPTPYGKGLWLSLWLDEQPAMALLENLALTGYRTVALKRMLRALEAGV